MDRIKKFMVIAFAALSFMAVSCDVNDQTEPIEEQLEVNANNISGAWTLAQWNGSALAEGTYLYIDFVRNDMTYTMYQNMDSFTDVLRKVTGSYNISFDVELGAIIRGSYDNDNGEWAHRYIVKSLTASQMVWVAKDDETFVQIFERIESIPVGVEED